MKAFLIFLFALLGVAVGSFLNVCIDRLPRNKSILNPPSHCEVCQHRLAAKDLIPLFSYLWLRGRCRYCHAAMPRRLFWMELATGIIFVFLYWWCVILKPDLGITAFAVMAFYACLFIIIFVLIIGAILGGVVAIVLVVVKKRKRKEMIPFGPFLSLAAMVTLLWGSQILNWYLGLM